MLPKAPSLLTATILMALALAGCLAGEPGTGEGPTTTPAPVEADEFGQAGLPTWQQIDAPSGLPNVDGAGEPTIGIPWNTDDVFFQSYANTYRIHFDGDEATWEDVTPTTGIPLNLDPMLHADPDTGRVWVGGLLGPCSQMYWSDDNGATWITTGNMCSGVRFDHQSVGSGPHDLGAKHPAYEHAVYYCGQLGAIACTTSYDGGETFLPPQDVPGPCGGFHGHIRVSRATGFVAVPVPDCGGDLGFVASSDNGLTWASHTIPETEEWTNGFDPSLQFGRPNGWLYYGMASEHGIHIGLSKDEGKSWEPIGGAMGNATNWLDVGRLHDPPVVAGTFADVQVGDDDRVAFSFMGLEGGPGADVDFLRSNQIYQCDERQDELIWHYYVATSYDAGHTWNVQRASDDPVQVGGIYDSVIDSSGSCRNLLDFNDMDIDSQGRVYVGFADGCTGACAEDPSPDSSGYRTEYAAIIRQTSGPGLFSAADQAGT